MIHPIYIYMQVHMHDMCTHMYILICGGKSKNVGGEHHGVLSSLVRKRRPMVGRRQPLRTPTCVCITWCEGVTVLTRSMHPHESEGLESHLAPLSSSLCLSRSLKWPPSRRFLIGSELPSFCALRTLPFPHFLSFHI